MNTQLTRCGWCQHNTVMLPVDHRPLIQHAGEGEILSPGALGWAVFQCAGCRGVSLAQGLYRLSGPIEKRFFAKDLSNQEFDAHGWYPTEPLIKTYPESVPEQIAETAAEAHGCLSVGHHRAAIIMARTVIEASAKAVGVDDRGIKVKIKKLYEQGLIYKYVMDAAEEIRESGNEVAHGDLVDQSADQDEAAAVLNLMDRVLDGLFIAPAEPAALRARRDARLSGTSAST
ncbi:DUF4145 domain-containing protein [Kitasatospora cineracea]|uniref:DUF4145 domain-containing protein n=1 Tax=Kitasatospora cineracea TaxID=88074 RepID=UPI00378EFF3F